MVKGCTFGKNAPDKFVGNLTAALLVRTLGITIEDSAAYFSKLGTLNGDRVGKFTSSVSQNNREQAAILLMPNGFIQPFKNLCNRPRGVSFPQKSQHEIEVAEEHRKQHLAALTALHGINFYDGNIRIGCCIFQEIVVGSAQVVLLVYPYRRLPFAHLIAHLPGQIHVSYRQKTSIHIIVDGPFVQHDLIGIIHADLVNGLSLLNERRDDPVDPIQFSSCHGKALPGFTAGRLILFLSKFCFVKVPLQFTDLTLLAAVADIRRLVQLRALCFLEVGTGFKALGLEASMAHFSVRKLAGGAHITISVRFISS